MNHTPEPWHVDALGVITGGTCSVAETYQVKWENCPASPFAEFGWKQAVANGHRIVACVNACAGMADPAAEIARLRAIAGEQDAGLGKQVVSEKLMIQAAADICRLREQNASLLADNSRLAKLSYQEREENTRLRAQVSELSANIGAHSDRELKLRAAVGDLLACFWEGRPKKNVRRDYHLMVACEAARTALEATKPA